MANLHVSSTPAICVQSAGPGSPQTAQDQAKAMAGNARPVIHQSDQAASRRFSTFNPPLTREILAQNDAQQSQVGVVIERRRHKYNGIVGAGRDLGIPLTDPSYRDTVIEGYSLTPMERLIACHCISGSGVHPPASSRDGDREAE